MFNHVLEAQTAAPFPRFLTVEEAAQLLGVSAARISMWIGECKLPVAARSEYAGFLLRTMTIETVGRELAEALTPKARFETPGEGQSTRLRADRLPGSPQRRRIPAAKRPVT